MALWSCVTCSKTFARKGDLTRHKLLHTGIKPHVCETCGKGFAQFSGLKTHRNTHSKAKPFTCGIGTCQKAFGDPSSRTRHRKETHRREGAYRCIVDDCGTRIKRRSAFSAHLRKHGIDPDLLDLDAIASQTGQDRQSSPEVHFIPPYVANKPQHAAEAQTASPPTQCKRLHTHPNRLSLSSKRFSKPCITMPIADRALCERYFGRQQLLW
ncbi:hypothetical protein BDN67DRAFT_236186 [Paxillus ammoniavirescens]|nr:hypothetical protein BDN67DRAFT_236186 [Paxillus ammoniavirescens]